MGKNSNPEDKEAEKEDEKPCNRCKKEKWCLHHVKFEGRYQHLCSSCLLITHCHMYCPYCLEDCGNPPEGLLKCTTCPRSVHVSCHRKAVAATLAAKEEPSASFRCLHCLNPNLEVVPLEMIGEGNGVVGSARKKLKGQNGCAVSMQDFVKAKLVLTASRLANAVMRRVAAEAEVAAKVAAMEAMKAKKEAKDALNRALAVAKEEDDKNRKHYTPPVSLVAQGKVNSEAIACKFPASALNIIPLTKSKVAGEPNGPAR